MVAAKNSKNRRAALSPAAAITRGTFDQVLAGAARAGVGADEIRAQLQTLRIRPVITAHPTEAKRVSILEKNRRIYLLLRDLESTRWTDRERNALGASACLPSRVIY
jgi:phosphoenolpyruvate carboxylase